MSSQPASGSPATPANPAPAAVTAAATAADNGLRVTLRRLGENSLNAVVSWTISRELARRIAERDSKKTTVNVLVVVTNDGAEMSRYVFPVGNRQGYIGFHRSGLNSVLVTLVEGEEISLLQLTHRTSEFCWRTPVLDAHGRFSTHPHLRPDHIAAELATPYMYKNVSRFNVGVTLRAVVDRGHFSNSWPTTKWLARLVTWGEPTPMDGCRMRGRATVNALISPLVLLWAVIHGLVMSLITLALLVAGIRHVNFAWLKSLGFGTFPWDGAGPSRWVTRKTPQGHYVRRSLRRLTEAEANRLIAAKAARRQQAIDQRAAELASDGSATPTLRMRWQDLKYKVCKPVER